MRGARAVHGETGLRFRYKLTGGTGPLRVALRGADGPAIATGILETPIRDAWADAGLSFTINPPASATDIVFTPPPGAGLLIDDLLLFEP